MCKRDGMGPHGQGQGRGRQGRAGRGGHGRGTHRGAAQGAVGLPNENNKQQCIERVTIRIEALQARLAELTR